MQVESVLVNIKKIKNPSVEYIETELNKKDIDLLRWAIVSVDDENYTVSVANLKV